MRINRQAQLLISGAVLFDVLVGVPAMGQYDLHQRPGMTTSDDPRRVPIPPRDTSKDPIVVLRGGTLIDGTGKPPVSNAVVIVQGNHILEAGPAGQVAIPAGASRTIDVSGLYIIPGLIDLHMHFRQQRGDDFAAYRDSPAATALRGVEKMGLYLDGGITAVRDVGAVEDVPIRLREAVLRRIVQGPRIFWSGKMIVTRGGHGDEITETASGHPKSVETNPGVRVATGPYDWRLAVREQIRMGADWIKLTAPITREEGAAAIDEAHMLGLRVTADAFGDYVTWLVEAGIDCIEHPLAIPDKTIALMASKGTFMVPTMVAFYNPLVLGYPSAHIPPGAFYFTMSRRFYMTHETNMDTLRKARAAGIKLGIGTDVPFEGERRYPGDYFVELSFFKQAGFTNKEILASATSTGAQILGMADKMGTIEKGKLADILVVGGDPLADIENLRKMRLVVANGLIVRDKVK